jgi:hypothetical protein
MKTTFLVVYDYGQGGLWAFIRAESADAIRQAYPELEVLKSTPDWMSPEIKSEIEASNTYDLDDPPKGLLASLVRERGGA